MRPALAHNAARLGLDGGMDRVDALIISHLHLDHVGGMPAQQAREVHLPHDLMPSQPKPCFLSDRAEAPGFDLSQAIAAINAAAPRRVLLSGHDTGDHALARMQEELDAETELLRAGATYRL